MKRVASHPRRPRTLAPAKSIARNSLPRQPHQLLRLPGCNDCSRSSSSGSLSPSLVDRTACGRRPRASESGGRPSASRSITRIAALPGLGGLERVDRPAVPAHQEEARRQPVRHEQHGRVGRHRHAVLELAVEATPHAVVDVGPALAVGEAVEEAAEARALLLRPRHAPGSWKLSPLAQPSWRGRRPHPAQLRLAGTTRRVDAEQAGDVERAQSGVPRLLAAGVSSRRAASPSTLPTPWRRIRAAALPGRRRTAHRAHRWRARAARARAAV